ncbi:MAG: redox-sensing transcriptional repressor Rex [Elusimicrobiota bacterium]
MTNNKNVIMRLSGYKNALNRLKDIGFVKVYSDNLGDSLGISPVQVRKDFSVFGITGNKKGGYIIEELIENLNKILGKNVVQKVIVIGVGNIGTALMNYSGFENEGIEIAAAFDINPGKNNGMGNMVIKPMEELEAIIKNEDVRLAILAVPHEVAQSIADRIIKAGVKGILNFAPINLNVPIGAVVNNVNLELELENVIYFVNAQNQIKEGIK